MVHQQSLPLDRPWELSRLQGFNPKQFRCRSAMASADPQLGGKNFRPPGETAAYPSPRRHGARPQGGLFLRKTSEFGRIALCKCMCLRFNGGTGCREGSSAFRTGKCAGVCRAVVNDVPSGRALLKRNRSHSSSYSFVARAFGRVGHHIDELRTVLPYG